MALEIVFAPGADDDLFAIYVYVAEAAGFVVADSYDTRLRAAGMKLADFPARGTPHDDLSPGLRSVPFERRATIYYRVTAKAVEIVRVLHSGRDEGRAFRN
ncbi:type II toxin-antitoxin system RelE/ParE family toxin [Sphingosinicella sp. LHD-64]|uniref:type II toxin-antitoxin system RelE/ParE family toxin n=1 Tax=Sphingosinicella sp. LHD-64 TaxID=3072139 RepID=UPI00280FD655|nr:type II toxin-antitoxin system RelE/ParE family toxin [Sphingosinicella sp. LHD-64]MDQ8758324.1 type II toxin-antitoxin system RelE/ParE family toxin [Sphingosinicella sp. LHD-64]